MRKTIEKYQIAVVHCGTMGYNLSAMRFGLFIRGKRNEMGWSQDELAARCPMDRKTVGRIERTDSIEDVDPQMLVLLAHGFGSDAATIREAYRERAGAQQPLKPSRPMGSSPYASRPEQGVPVFNQLPGGKAVDYRDVGANQHARLPISIEAIGDKNAFAMQIVGNSMEPDWRDGDFAIFAPAAEWNDYDECFVQFNSNRDEGSTFKRVRVLRGSDGKPTGELELIPNNIREHKPIVVRWANHIDGNIGEVVRVVRCVGEYRGRAWKAKPEDQNEGWIDQRQSDDDLPVIQRER
jgi:transcriptional regulator with XRE-family HTH domain